MAFSFDSVKEKFDNESFSKDEIQDIVWGDYHSDDVEWIEEIEGDSGRWVRHMQTIIRFNDKYYSIAWQQGLTEMQPNEYMDQPEEVERVEEVVTKVIVKYKKVKKVVDNIPKIV